ncbi:MAG: SBBP repeat-containing protein [Bacteroidia bacterium]|nr:SBBP repeat-containing protein [Bacteroidia bacterium]
MKRWVLVSILISSAGASPGVRDAFIENRGQWHPDVLYLSRLNGLNAWITRQGVVYDFYELRPRSRESDEEDHSKFTPRLYERRGHVIRLSHMGVSGSVWGKGESKLPTYYNYFFGNNPSQWAPLVPLYREVVVHRLYTGIDQRWYFDEGKLRYDYIVAPGSDPAQIRLRVEGALSIRVQGDRLLLGTRFGLVEQAGLQAYQLINGERHLIPVRWEVSGSEIGFSVGPYDTRYPLVIDPYVWSRYLGGSGADAARGMALYRQDEVFVCGATSSATFPTSTGAYDQSLDGTDAFFVRLNPATGEIRYATFFGGGGTAGGQDEAYAIALNSQGDLYLTGYTTVLNFPTTSGAYSPIKPSPGGNKDAFVVRFNAAGTQLLYGTYVGGSQTDEGFSVVVDALGHIYATGVTYSSNFPKTATALDGTLGGPADAFVLRLNPAGGGTADLIYGTFLGGSSIDEGASVALDASGNMYLAGYTGSTDFPLGAGGYRPTPGSGGSGFFVKINSTGTTIQYGTYIGGNNQTAIHDLSLDRDGFVYLTGSTTATDFPTTLGSYDGTLSAGNRDVFVVKLNPDPSLPRAAQLVMSTLVGASGEAIGYSIAVDTAKNIYVAGRAGRNPVFPTTSNAISQTYSGGLQDAIAFKLNPQGTQLLYSTYIGGSGLDEARAIAVDTAGVVYVAGFTDSPNFPRSVGDPHGGAADAFVMRLQMSSGTPGSLPFGGESVKKWQAYPTQVTGQLWIRNLSRGPLTFEVWDAAGRQMGSFSVPEGLSSVSLPYAPGLYFIREQEGLGSEKILLLAP